MKSRFTTLDIKVLLRELNQSGAIGLRVASVYDIDNKTYLIKLTGTEKKFTLFIESGNRIHLTDFDWPKNSFPSGFSMKCRKHINGRRLSSANQLGIDRIVDFCFGYDEAAYHLIIELYDRGNIILTDHEYTILQILRVRTDNDDVRFAHRERYPLEKARQEEPLPTKEKIKEILMGAKPKEMLKRVLNQHLVFGQSLLEHCMLEHGLDDTLKVKEYLENENDLDILMDVLKTADDMMNGDELPIDKGFIIQKKETVGSLTEGKTGSEELLTYTEFHPFLFKQHQNRPYKEFNSFNKAVDEFFAKLESQKLDVKALAKEKDALKKLENVKKDHEKRVELLQKAQDEDMKKAELIEMNLGLIDHAIKTLNSCIANQIDWEEIEKIVSDAQAQHDPVALAIKDLKLATNQFTIRLSDPYASSEESDEDMSDSEIIEQQNGALINKEGKYKIDVDIDLGMNAFSNARSYHSKRRHASKKEEKTLHASKKALKSAQRKTRETLKEVATTAVINKARKSYWFEKFLWFISSENYLAIGGRDQQQNEVIVKRYLRPGDLYVHADIHGATSVVLKNPSGQPVPPRTLLEAGTFAICHSVAWEARVVTSAWWVHHNQVSKTAPSGEYLTTGSFMIRGKKNFLPPTQLVMGFGFIFKLDDSCIEHHLNERKVKDQEAEPLPQIEEETTELELIEDDNDEEVEKLESLTLNSSAQNVEERNELEVEKEVVVPDDNGSDEDDLSAFPDTSIQLQHVTGTTYHLQSSIAVFPDRNTSDQKSDDLRQGDSESYGKDQGNKQRLSAKQRRDLRKQRKGKSEEVSPRSQDNNVLEESSAEKMAQPENVNKNNIKPQPSKRGQKSKQKKISEKYKDQDEEDREAIMQLLGSAGKPKEASKKNKGKSKQAQQTKQKNRQKGGGKGSQHIYVQDADLKHEGSTESNQFEIKGEEIKEDEEVRNIDQEKENASILDSLTGLPTDEDLLLFSIPVCAPYSSIQSYKFKVKVTPGTGRRGKAAKTALHLFMTSKDTSQREKDLLRSLKDVDISRNIPGKVKVSAPNLQKSKHK